MQDKNSSNQQLIDLGWQRMSTLLDKELPQPGRHRYFRTWPFVAAGIFLGLAALGYTALQNAEPDALQKIPASHTPTEVASSHTLSSKAEATQEENGMQTITEHPAQFVDAIESKSSSTEKVGVKGNTSITEEESVLRVSPAPGTTVQRSTQGELASSSVQMTGEPVKTEVLVAQTPIESSKPQNTSSSSAITPAPQGEKSHSNEFLEVPLNEIAETEVNHGKNDEPTVEYEGVDESMTNRLMSESVSLPTTARSIITVASLSENQPVAISDRWNALMIPVARPDRDGSFGLDAMVATHLNADANPFYGIEAGLSTTLISGKRFSIHGGVSYGYYNVDGFGLGIFNADHPSEEELFGNGNGGGPDTNVYTGFPIYAVQDVLTGDLEYSEAQQLTEKFHYIHLPLRVEFRILPRLLLMAGVKASALLAAPARYRLNDNRFSAPQSTLVSNSKSFLYNYDIIRKIDVAPIVGLSYDIGQRLSLDATYSHGMLHYINSDDAGDRNDYHRSASLGVRYRIL